MLRYVKAIRFRLTPTTFDLVKKDIKLVFTLCCIAIAGIFFVQLFWIRNYYEINNDRFIKEVNLAFEDAVKKEFSVRTDTIEELLYQFLIDTSKTRITSTWNANDKVYIYIVADVQDTLDYFSYKGFDFPILSQSDTNKSKVAGRLLKHSPYIIFIGFTSMSWERFGDDRIFILNTVGKHVFT